MILILLDIDGTLCPAMGEIPASTKELLLRLKEDPRVHLGVVGGSDRPKALRQLGTDVMEDVLDHAFSENGAVYYRGRDLVARDKLEDFLPVQDLNRFIGFLLLLIASSECPWRTGTFIERRACMLNVSPIGRACTQQERELFFAWDKEWDCRKGMVEQIKERFGDLPLDVSIGGQISIDISPRGFNKTRCLHYIDGGAYDTIHFIGDRTMAGGNDHELFIDQRVVGHTTGGPLETEAILERIVRQL